MYATYFGLNEAPFSLTPDPRYLYLSQHHREALAHLLYGIGEGGGFVQLTGEVGTGKTTLCRCLLEQLPPQVDVALILNPRLTALELLKAICDELRIAYPPDTNSLKELVDKLNQYLLDAHARGRRTVLIIDEAQNLAPDVLEQIRLLTNLETATEKLLQIILIGQPELAILLDRRELRQLAQRVTARYHLRPLTQAETRAYIDHRLAVSGQKGTAYMVFTRGAVRRIYRLSGGIPRLVNIICDRALLGAYARDRNRVDNGIARRAAVEVLGRVARPWYARTLPWASAATVCAAAAIGLWLALGEWRPDLLAEITRQLSLDKPFAQATSAVTVPGTAMLQSAVQLPSSPRSPTLLPSPSPDLTVGLALAQLERAAEQAALPSDKLLGKSEPREGPGEQPDKLLLWLKDAARVPAIANRAGSEAGADRAVLAGLFSRWGQDYRQLTGKTLCERARSGGLQCLFRRGTWNTLRTYNLPALVELTAPDASKRSALVTRLSGNTVTLDLGGQEQTLPLAGVDRFWLGDFLLLWRPPQLNARLIAPGSRSRDVIWLRQQFDRLEGHTLPTADQTLYDEALKQRVISFQRSRLLRPDGVVGEQTLIQLSAAVPDVAVPALSQADARGSPTSPVVTEQAVTERAAP